MPSLSRLWRPTYSIVALVIAWLAVAAVVAGLLFESRNAELDRAFESSAALALVLEEHTAGTFKSVDIALAAIGDVLRLAPALPKRDPAFQEALKRRLQSIPAVRAIYVIGPQGDITHDTDYPATPDASLADRPYLKALINDPSLAGQMSPPLLRRSGLGWFVAVSRAVGHGDQRSVVVAAVQPNYFEALYRRMGLRDDFVIMLFHRDRTLLAQYPFEPKMVGRSFADVSGFPSWAPQRESGTYLSEAGIFDYERIVSYRAVQGAPLVVAINQSTERVLSEWRRSAVGAVIAMAAVTALVTLLFAILFRQRRLRERERERNAQAEKLAALGQLTSGVSHDFANLLNIVSVNLQIISMCIADERRTLEAVAVAQRAVSNGSGLINRLLAFAKRQPLQLRSGDLNALLEDAGDLLRQAAGDQIELVIRTADNLAPCIVDKTQLEVALVNLVVNAKDAMAGIGRIVLRTQDCDEHDAPAELRRSHSKGFVRLTVEDTGPGMSREHARRAFEPYFSTKGTGGTGLGLPQVIGFMQQLGGTARIQSTLGVGTRVQLFFPKAD